MIQVHISIIMPAYNVEAYIEESIHSVIRQTFTDWELIIVNDGSIDNTANIITSFLCDSRIKLFTQPNQGVSKARNLGLNHSSGHWISFLDADDLLHPHFLEKLVNKQKETAANFIFSLHNRLTATRCYLPALFQSPKSDSNFLLLYATVKLWIAIGSFLVEKQLLINNNIHFSSDYIYNEDIEFIFKILCFANVAVVTQELMTYRLRAGSATQSPWKYNEKIQRIFVIEKTIDFIKKNYSGSDKDKIIRLMSQDLLHSKYRFIWMMIINRNLAEALNLLNTTSFYSDIETYSRTCSFHHKLRCKIILSKKTFLWEITTLGRKLN